MLLYILSPLFILTCTDPCFIANDTKLVAMQKVDKECMNELIELFNKLDVDDTGSLNKADILMLEKMRKGNAHEVA